VRSDNVYWLRSGGKLGEGYVNVAPGVHLPMCLWSIGPPFECVLPKGHDGPHYLMESPAPTTEPKAGG
jgi:hypothetical protein